MKKYVLLLTLAIALSGCVKEQSALTSAVDYYVEQLSTLVQSYGLRGDTTETEIYSISALGRLVVVKINEPASEEEYAKLEKFLERKYKSNPAVSRVYINQGGTVVVDCRR